MLFISSRPVAWPSREQSLCLVPSAPHCLAQGWHPHTPNAPRVSAYLLSERGHADLVLDLVASVNRLAQ